jgi:hypothetical protein
VPKIANTTALNKQASHVFACNILNSGVIPRSMCLLPGRPDTFSNKWR